MENMGHIIRLLFKCIPAKTVVGGKIDGCEFRKDDFTHAAFAYLKGYSESELSNMWMYYRDTFEGERVFFGRGSLALSSGIDVFDALFYYAPRMLVVQNNEVLCKYSELMSWRMVTFEISEDLLVSAYWAVHKNAAEMADAGFSWKTVIGCNNIPLGDILKRGISENHFHLYGSAPIFHISWLSMMNNVLESKTADSLRRYDADRRNSSVRYRTDYGEDSLSAQHCQAALIRMFLYAVVADVRIHIGDYGGGFTGPYGNAAGGSGDGSGWKDAERQHVIEILRDGYRMKSALRDIQGTIDILRCTPLSREEEDTELVDYALWCVQGGARTEEGIFSGERWFLYSCLHRIYKNQFTAQDENLFYAYCLLKENIRAEMIQSNHKVGFVNFQKYQNRKNELISDAIFGNDMVRGAVRSGMLSSYMKSLELRVSPCNTADQTCRMIRRLDSVIGEPRDKYFYTLHFIKGEDKTDYGSSMLQCRHAVKRKKVEKQARALIALRERYPECAMRILGIDAASNEIGCRPEVFAVSFRRLKSHVRAGEDSRSTRRVPQLRATYHVGEDFLDPADGLRAIDEAVNFLNLDCGDRLGHALALGLDVEEWYRSKNYRILIPQQDYLDNLAWMYNRLIELNISGLEVLMGHLEKKYEEYFDRVYARHMDYGIIDEILKETRRQYRHAGIMNAFHNDRYRFDIFQYYKAWKLRGDDPELYERGYYLADDYGPAEMQCRLNLRFPKDYNIRYRPEIFLLNYYYQFDREVREEGNKRVEIKIHPSYIRAVQMLQKEMQKLVGRNGIAIETNPSSNFLIGTFKDYAKHPIFTFYNKGLTGDPSLLAECAQLSVSVNTDDQGVFSTSLENEYALLAVALENVKDADGKPAYAKSMVYDWIDAVRQMGNDQSFRPEGYRELLGGEETADL